MKRKLKILIVEDSEDDALLIMHRIKKDGLDPIYKRVDSKKKMRVALENEKWDIVLSDYSMPNFSGLDALELFKQKDLDIPFILISGTIGEEIAVETMKKGGNDYIMKDKLARLAPSIRREIQEAKTRKENRKFLKEKKKAEEELRESYQRLQKTLNGTINALSKTIEARDPYTSGHQKSVARLAKAIAIEMRIEKNKIHLIEMAALIHDLGKVIIPASILSKPGKITDLEFSFIKAHPQTGFEIIEDTGIPSGVADIILQHHERLDGSGYPEGLKGKGILIEAKILAVADVVEAMSSHRPYRSALGIDKAIEEIVKNKGKKYDPKVVAACVRLFREKDFKFNDNQ